MKDTRIQKALSDAGVCSRRHAEELITEGKVTVNGQPAVIGQKIDVKTDVLTVEGKTVQHNAGEKLWYVALNKPRGYVTTMSDELGRRCVTELVSDIPARLYPIGRLDRNSEGLLLMTNDGEFANDIMHPRGHISKTYRVTVPADVTEEQLVKLSAGVAIDENTVTLPAQVTVLTKEPGRTVLQIVITEGKNRQIRRMCENVDLDVSRLKRTAEGAVRLGMLQPGKWRELTKEELAALRAMIKKGQQPQAEKKKNPPEPQAKKSVRITKKPV